MGGVVHLFLAGLGISLKLNRNMDHAMVGRDPPQAVQQQPALILRLAARGDVGTEDMVAAGQRPRMDVVNARYVRHRLEPLAQACDIQAGRRCLHENQLLLDSTAAMAWSMPWLSIRPPRG